MKIRIQKRKFSSNIIEAATQKENGEDKWYPYLCPLVKKETGDPLTEEMFNFLTSKKENEKADAIEHRP